MPINSAISSPFNLYAHMGKIKASETQVNNPNTLNMATN